MNQKQHQKHKWVPAQYSKKQILLPYKSTNFLKRCHTVLHEGEKPGLNSPTLVATLSEVMV